MLSESCTILSFPAASRWRRQLRRSQEAAALGGLVLHRGAQSAGAHGAPGRAAQAPITYPALHPCSAALAESAAARRRLQRWGDRLGVLQLHAKRLSAQPSHRSLMRVSKFPALLLCSAALAESVAARQEAAALGERLRALEAHAERLAQQLAGAYARSRETDARLEAAVARAGALEQAVSDADVVARTRLAAAEVRLTPVRNHRNQITTSPLGDYALPHSLPSQPVLRHTLAAAHHACLPRSFATLTLLHARPLLQAPCM